MQDVISGLKFISQSDAARERDTGLGTAKDLFRPFLEENKIKGPDGVTRKVLPETGVGLGEDDDRRRFCRHGKRDYAI